MKAFARSLRIAQRARTSSRFEEGQRRPRGFFPFQKRAIQKRYGWPTSPSKRIKGHPTAIRPCYVPFVLEHIGSGVLACYSQFCNLLARSLRV